MRATPIKHTIVVLTLGCAFWGPQRLAGQDFHIPEPHLPGVRVNLVLHAASGALRLALDPASDGLFYLLRSGTIYEIVEQEQGYVSILRYTTEDHGLVDVQGMAFGPDGTLYLAGNEPVATSQTYGIVRKGAPGQEDRIWTTVARTEVYPKSNTAFDHNFSGIVVSPAGDELFVNSGSRTDHGEEQTAGGLFPGAREVALTAAIFRLPAEADNLLLPNDRDRLRADGYLYAEGVRNSFDLAFTGIGDLFATENAGERDDSEELNWIREGHHYGFPWRIGGNVTPQQFDGYDPETDLLLNKSSHGYKQGFFYDDSDFPPPPASVVFTEPIVNKGPDATSYRSETTGLIRHDGERSTFTAHRSPLGLVFDTSGALPEPYAGDGFVLGWNDGSTGSGSLLEVFDDPGMDLLHLELKREVSNYTIGTTRLVSGFNNPIDAALVKDRIFVLDWGGEHAIWEVSFDGDLIPVELSRFDAFVDATRTAQLIWETRSEINNAGFQVQYRARPDAFRTLGFVEGHGSSIDPHSYRYTIPDLAPGEHSVRLRQVDFDGTAQYSREIDLFLSSDARYTLSPPYPNPFNPVTTFTLTLSSTQHVRIELYDLLGRRHREIFDGILTEHTRHDFQVDASDLAGGVYLLKVSGAEFEDVRQLRLLK